VVVGVIFFFILEYIVSCVLGHCSGKWNAEPPYSCDGAPDNSLPISWCITVSVVCLFLLPAVFLICAAFPKFRGWLTVRGTFLPMASSGSLLALIATNECLIHYGKGYDDGYSSETMVWSLGQIGAMVLIAGQILEIFTYLMKPSEDSKINSGLIISRQCLPISRYVVQ
jgi:hypothetical protein